MILEIQTSTYACSLCKRTYNLMKDAEKCESRCAKLLKSPDISVLGLTTRAYNILKIAEIDTIDEVLGTTDSQLLKLRGFGQGCLNDLHQQIQFFEAKMQETINQGNDKSRKLLIKEAINQTRPQEL